jgi:DNA-binding transcriptional MerR regulator
MPSLISQVISWPVLVTALLVFGFAPGAVLRLIVLLFRRDDPRRQELLGELYAVPRIERPFWVIEQLEVALFEGLRNRFARRVPDDLARTHESLGYRGPTACAAAGITYRQLEYWARTGLVEPSLRATRGPGHLRLYSFHDILMLTIIKRLLGAGLSLPRIGAAIAYLRGQSLDEISTLTLMGDDEEIYPCRKDSDVVESLAKGQGVFGIAVGRIWQQVDSVLMELPGELHSSSAI